MSISGVVVTFNARISGPSAHLCGRRHRGRRTVVGSADDYYRRSSSAGFIPAISVPTLVVHSRDDPFLPAGAIPESALESNPAVTPLITNHGGHVGFVAGGVPFVPTSGPKTVSPGGWRIG